MSVSNGVIITPLLILTSSSVMALILARRVELARYEYERRLQAYVNSRRYMAPISLN